GIAIGDNRSTRTAPDSTEWRIVAATFPASSKFQTMLGTTPQTYFRRRSSRQGGAWLQRCAFLHLPYGSGVIQQHCNSKLHPTRKRFVANAICRLEWASSFRTCRHTSPASGSCSDQDETVSTP